ncbi:MAG TPA: lysylphosphatidylglycerol synthase transmembrane domain-containing protein [Gaiellaceae bacterium]|nr:lysylphosphatidylglycerol synthase transmembrane domain-containing protein [Gaiellaceae bacterium]
MLPRILDGVNAFIDQLGSVEPLPVFLAILAQVGRLASVSMAWRNVLAAAYPDRPVPRRRILGAYFAGVGVNALAPLRAGDAVRIVLAHRAVPGSTYTTVVSSTLVLSIFDIAAASSLLIWAALTQDALPGLSDLRELPSFDFSWLIDHPLATELILASLLLGVVILGIWIHGHVVDFWQRVKQAFAVVRQPMRYVRTVAFWQACDWSLRFVGVWFLLDAFDVPQTIENVLLVQVSASIATMFPLTPAGIGTEQAFLLYVFDGTVASSKLLAFSVGMRGTLLATNVVAGFTAIALTLKTLRYKEALQLSAGRKDEPPEESPGEDGQEPGPQDGPAL